MEGLVVAVLAAVVLFALWASATRRHLDRGRHRTPDWEEATTAPRLWTSTVPCPHCRADAGLLSTEADEVWFTCLACGQRHRRDTKT